MRFLFTSMVAASLTAQTTTSMMTFPASASTSPSAIELQSDWDSTFSITEPSDETYSLKSQSKLSAAREFSQGQVLYLGAGYEKSAGVIADHDSVLSAPFTKLDTLKLNSRYLFHTNGNWSGFAIGNVDLATADQANIADGFSMIASAGASYAINPKLKFSFGLLTTRSLATELQAMPIIGIDWEITDRLKLRTLNGAFLTYDLGESTAVDISLQYRDQAFDIQNYQGTVFMSMDDSAVLEESAVVGTVGVNHRWKDVFSIRAFAEFAGKRDVEIRVDKAEIPEKAKSENALSFGVEGGIRF